MEATIFTDGAARGNPGPAAAAYVIRRPGSPPIEYAEKLGTATNNVAEYTALIMAVERAAELGLRRIEVFSDSELMVKQFRGEYAVKNAELRDLHAEARQLARHFDVLKLSHVRRAENRRADELCNAVLDGRPPDGPRDRVGKASSPSAARPQRNLGVDEQAVACLRAALSAASASAGGGAAVPTAEVLWEQLWSVLEDGGVLKTRRKKSS
jgi:ribonuclease HI